MYKPNAFFLQISFVLVMLVSFSISSQPAMLVAQYDQDMIEDVDADPSRMPNSTFEEGDQEYPINQTEPDYQVEESAPASDMEADNY